MFGRLCKQKDNGFLYPRFGMFSTQRHFPSIPWEQKALFLTVYRWLAKNKREVWASLSRTAAENSNPWLQAVLFPPALLWKMQDWGISQARAVHQGHGEGETLSHFHSPTCSLKADSLSVTISGSFSVFGFQLWSPGLQWTFSSWKEVAWTMTWRWLLASVCTGTYQSLQWIMYIPLPFDFCSIGFHFLHSLCKTKADFPNFLSSQTVSSIIIKNCAEEHRIFQSQASPKSLCCQCLQWEGLKQSHL